MSHTESLYEEAEKQGQHQQWNYDYKTFIMIHPKVLCSGYNKDYIHITNQLHAHNNIDIQK